MHIKYAHLASVEFEDSRTPITAYIKHLAWLVETVGTLVPGLCNRASSV